MRKPVLLVSALAVLSAVAALPLAAADPAIEKVIRKAYELVLKGDTPGFLSTCHPEVSKFKGSFDTGYSPGRSASLGELMMLSMGVKDGETFQVRDLKVEVVRVEGDRAIAWVKYHALTSRPSSLEMTKGEIVRDEWDARDYVVLKKHAGEWRLRRLEDRAGHFFPLEQQKPGGDPFGGVK